MKIAINAIKILMGLIIITMIIPAMTMAAQPSQGSGPSIGKTTQDGEYKIYSVKQIKKGAGKLGLKLIGTYGYVDQVDAIKEGQIRTYTLKGDEGGKLLIQTTKSIPDLYKRLYVKGVLHTQRRASNTNKMKSDGVNRNVYLYEEYREYSQAKPDYSVDNQDKGERREDRINPDPDTPKPAAKTGYIKFIAIGAAVLMVVLVISLLMFKLLIGRKKGQENQMTYTGSYQSFSDGTIKGGGTEAPAAAAPVAPPADDSEITVKRSGTTIKGFDDATIKYLAGHLEVVEGGQTGDLIPLCGGNKITIGRTHTKGKGPTFIGLDDPSRELSRCQAVISYEQSSGKFYIEQKGTNAMVLDNQEMTEGDTRELNDGSTIGIPPEYVFTFRLGRCPR